MLPDLDPVIHAPTRLRIMSTLAVLGDGDCLSFTRLQAMLELTAGNLITHLRKLEVAGFVASNKTGGHGSATTQVRLTPVGRRAFDDYTAALRTWLDSTHP